MKTKIAKQMLAAAFENHAKEVAILFAKWVRDFGPMADYRSKTTEQLFEIWEKLREGQS